MEPVEPVDDPRPAILFDGECGFCNGAVRRVAAWDRRGRFRFAPLGSPAARRALAFAGPEVDIEELPDSIALADEEGVHVESAACLRIVRALGFPWAAFAWVGIFPRPLLDAAYRFFARNRYRWFGRSVSCPAPPPDLAARFLDMQEEISEGDDGRPPARDGAVAPVREDSPRVPAR